jgi:hypothetical protein
MDEECAESLRREFGYVPRTDEGESWTVYQDRTLIVIHQERRPRLYPRGADGSFYEIEPLP